MKLIIFLTTCLFCYVSEAQVSFSTGIGAGLSKFSYKLNSNSNQNSKPGFCFSIYGNVNWPISDDLDFQAGVSYEKLQGKIERETTINFSGGPRKEVFKRDTDISYLIIPLKVRFQLGSIGKKLGLGVGPSFGFALSGRKREFSSVETNNNGTITIDGYDIDNKIDFGSADSALKRFNLMLGLSADYLINEKLGISLYSNLGLTNLDQREDYSMKTNAIVVSLYYVFKKSKK